ncbi:hypothetical protein BCR34DRAFT_478993 [Clohesyomyces aquaticus]|uniref:Mediator complex subunit 27-domain-containing protein n=1 Tax=Clohesyomyces aquaticus TaxID=1231657 RepID=A0A1Y1ZX71_9PLEO|nr:hypothetical protein BCR34DRAFT_478993 [Clohesyomyces aquaticus]
MDTAEAAGQPAVVWDEAQCNAALAHVERLQGQLDNLRLAIPRIIEPFSSEQATSTDVFKGFKQALIGSQNDLKSFRVQWHTPEYQSILVHARKSYSANPDLSASAQVPRYGWIQSEIAEKKALAGNLSGLEEPQEIATGLGKEDIALILDEFCNTYPDIRVGMKDDNHEIMIKFEVDDLRLKFRVTIDTQANGGRHNLNAECLGTNKLFPVMTRCISTRPYANDLKYLLDMIAAYKTVKSTTCAKCSRLNDGSALIPVARRSKQNKESGGNTETVWEAFHESCLG